MASRHVKHSNPNPDARRKRKRRIVWFVAPALLLLAGGTYYALTRPISGPASITPKEFPTAPEDKGRTNILLIGTDARPGDTGGNTDVLILCSVDNPHHRIELISVPRDTRVTYPDGSVGKINEAYTRGGAPLVVHIVQDLLHQNIDNYALTHFGGLVDVINTLGGITVNVKERMYYNTGDKQWNIINLHQGTQTLNGVQALGFVRYRHDALGDIGRTGRQQEFIKALSKKLLEPQNITKLPTLASEFSKTIDTNMSLIEVGSLMTNAEKYKKYQLISETLPGSFQNPTASSPESYWVVNLAQAQYVTKKLFEQGLTQQNPVQDPSYTQNWSPPPAVQPQNNMTQSGNGVTPKSTSSPQQTHNKQATDAAVMVPAGEQNATTTDESHSYAVTPNPTGMHEWTVVAPSAYIRSGPGLGYDVIASVVEGQRVFVSGTSGEWMEVEVSGDKFGFIAKRLLKEGN